MTKKDYILIARTIKELVPMRADEHTRNLVAASFADMLARDNGAFRRHTFLSACGAVDG